MGAKTPSNANEKRPLTCDDCQKDFQTIRALKSHTIAKHPEKHKQLQGSANPEQIESKDERKTALVPPTARSSRRLQLKKSVDKETDFQDIPINSRKTVFECPECLKVFQVYFSAFKHIQKRHFNDKDGNPETSSDTSDLIKPVRKEICIVCSKIYGEGHSCTDCLPSSIKESSNRDLYCCLGCNQSFTNLDMFDKHVPETHSTEVETLFFETNTEFLIWKCSAESQLRVKYLTLSPTIPRQFYQCNYVSTKNSANITHLCPSLLITQELSKGLQVQYYKKHYEHKCEYVMPKQYENNIIKPMSQNNDVFDSLLTDVEKDLDDLYPKFKKLLNSIIIGAASININNLKKLYGSAIEMQTCLNSYEEEHEDSSMLTKLDYLNKPDTADKNLVINDFAESTDNSNKQINTSVIKTVNDQVSKALNDPIAKALEGTRVSARLKRKSESSASPVIKKTKLSTDKNIIKTKPGTKENSSITKDVKLVSPRINKSSPITQSPSFNDTYKQFIDSALNDSKKEPTSKKIVKKEVVKTKIGQFMPSPKRLPLLKMESESVDSTLKKSPKSLIKGNPENVEIVKQSPGSLGQVKVNSETVDSILKTSPKSGLVEVNSENVDSIVKKGLRKPGPMRVNSENVDSIVQKGPRKPGPMRVNSENVGSIVQKGPKKPGPMRVNFENVDSIVQKKKLLSSPRTSIANIKLEEVDYEILEQENDCNILVLKI